MGGSGSKILYANPISEKPEGESSIYRYPDFTDKLHECPQPKLNTMKAILLNTYEQYGNNKSLGRIIRKKDTEPVIDYLTYKSAIDMAAIIGSALVHGQFLSTSDSDKNLNFVGIFSKNRREWSLVDMSCLLYKLVSVPIYDTLGDENITYVLKHTSLTTCFVNEQGLKALMKTKDLDKLQNLICFDEFTPEQTEYFTEKNIKLISFEDLQEIGKKNRIDFNEEKFDVKPEDCLTFSYTSGTTGPPKAAMLSHKNFTSFMAAIKLNKDVKFHESDIALSYLPLPHILEREFLYSGFFVGMSVVYYSGNVQAIKDDLALVKPTIFISVPRLYSRFYDIIKSKFKDVSGWTKTALDYGLNKKLDNVSTSGAVSHSVYDRIFFQKTKQALGGRVRIMVSGSAPLLPDVQQFMKVVIGAPLIQGYGQTESTGAAFITDGGDPKVRHVGGPTSNFEFKLVDIPEMNYLSTDKDENGNLTPRGEIWMRGPGVFMGYYQDEAKTKEAVTEDGWLKTGDVGALSHDTKAMSIVDRKKNIFKLQQGEYVAAEKVENIYLKSDYISEIFLHGDSTESFVVTIAVPEKAQIEKIAKEKGIEKSYQELCQDKEIKKEILNNLNDIGKNFGLMGFEQAKNIHLDPMGFMARGILSSTMKVQRHEARKFYGENIKDMYAEGMIPLNKQKK